MVGGIKTGDDPAHTWFDMWGSVEALFACQGWFSLLSLPIRVSLGWVGGHLMDVLGPDALGLHRCFSIRSQERWIQLAHEGQTVMIRVVQQHHTGTLFRLAWDLSIIGLGSTTTLGDELI